MNTYAIQFYYKVDNDWREACIITKATSVEEAKEKLQNDIYFSSRETQVFSVAYFSDEEMEENIWLVYERT